MKLKDVVQFSIQATIRGRSRAILTITAVAIGVCSVMLISTLGHAATTTVNHELDKIGFESLAVFGNDESSKLYASDSDLLQSKIPNISSASPIVMLYGSYRMKNLENNAVFWGVDADVHTVLDMTLLHGRMFNNSDIQGQKKHVIIDAELAKTHYFRENVVGKSITISVDGVSKEFEIIGIVSPQKDGLNKLVGGVIPAFIYLPYTTINQMRAKNDITQIAVRCTKSEDFRIVEEKILQVLSRNKQGEYRAENIAGYVNGFRTVTSIVALIISAIAAISLCVAGLGIMNAMLASVTERHQEIGICMAVGAKQHDILKCFMAEGAIISMLGGVLGGIIGIIIALLLSYKMNLSIRLNTNIIFIIEAATVFCGIVFSVVPAIRASKLDPIQTLRSE